MLYAYNNKTYRKIKRHVKCDIKLHFASKKNAVSVLKIISLNFKKFFVEKEKWGFFSIRFKEKDMNKSCTKVMR